MVGSMIGGRTGGMIGGLAGAMLGGRQLRGLGRMISGRGKNDPQDDAIDLNNDQAEVLVRAMCNSAKADGHVDATETDQILSELGNDGGVSDAEREFLKAELGSPMIPAADVARSVPDGLKAEAYAVSLIAINVDTMEEAQYLSELSDALGLSKNDRDNIHDDLGVDLLA